MTCSVVEFTPRQSLTRAQLGERSRDYDFNRVSTLLGEMSATHGRDRAVTMMARVIEYDLSDNPPKKNAGTKRLLLKLSEMF